MHRKRFSWVALVGIGLAVLVAVSAASAVAARSAASPFELVLQGRYEWDAEVDPYGLAPEAGAVLVGTFTSGAPFCESGTAADPDPNLVRVRRYTCADGSGTLTLGMTNPAAAQGGTGRGEWTIIEGSGRYAGLHGKGTYGGEMLDVDPEYGASRRFRTTSQGFVAADAVAPSLAFTSASVKKLRRPAGAYSIKVALSLRDDVAGNAVAYRLRVREGLERPRDRRLFLLDEREGSTASDSVSMTLRVVPSSKRVRSVVLLLTVSDPVGNEVSITRLLKLPR